MVTFLFFKRFLRQFSCCIFMANHSPLFVVNKSVWRYHVIVKILLAECHICTNTNFHVAFTAPSSAITFVIENSNVRLYPSVDEL